MPQVSVLMRSGDSGIATVTDLPAGFNRYAKQLEKAHGRVNMLSEDHIELLAQEIADGNASTPAQIVKLAKKYGLPEYEMKLLIRHRGIGKKTAEALKLRALHKTAAALEAQGEKAKEDTAAFVAVAKIAGEGLYPAGGVSVNTTVTVDQRRAGDTEATIAFIERMRERQLQGAARRLIPADTPSDT